MCNLDKTAESEFIVNNERAKFSVWLSANKLSLNVKKTKFMVFHSTRKKVKYPTLRINNILDKRVEHFNFLGLHINSNLSWVSHLDHIFEKF